MKLLVEFVKQSYLHIAINDDLTEATDRCGAWHFAVAQRLANEPDKGEATTQIFLINRVAKDALTLHDKDIEHFERK